MNDKEFIDEMYHVAFGASETRHEHTHEEVHARLLEISNKHYEMSKDKKEDRDMETPVVAQPRSFLEVLGYHRNPDGTMLSVGMFSQVTALPHKEESEDE